MANSKKRSYYAIIPANVRYDNNLSANAKLLYGEITALCNDKGYCWASNQYFANLYGVSPRSIVRWISSLEQGGYIYSTEVYENHISYRQISLNTPRQKCLPHDKNVYTPHDKNVHTPHDKNVTHNITENNTTVINKSVSQSKEKEELDGRTDGIQNELKRQIDYGYFEDNFPEDLSGLDALIGCLADMLISPTTKINGCVQQRSALKSYIDKADSETVREFLDHMRGTKMRDVKNIRAYWQSAFINFIREEELTKLTI
ncbi:MAG TPA: hypothetical protein DHW78_00650 [Ruminococcaceae bacterium]|jgi:hypothetical protein|nr:hypothetical protein [Oscillospiraceae bacterium]